MNTAGNCVYACVASYHLAVLDMGQHSAMLDVGQHGGSCAWALQPLCNYSLAGHAAVDVGQLTQWVLRCQCSVTLVKEHMWRVTLVI